MRLIQAGLLAIISFALISCATHKADKDFSRLRFHVEAGENFEDSSRLVTVTLPTSRSEIRVLPVPSIPSFEIAAIELNSNRIGSFATITLTDRGRLHLMNLCSEHHGMRLVLIDGDKAVGSWRISRIITDGQIVTFIEIPAQNLSEWGSRFS